MEHCFLEPGEFVTLDQLEQITLVGWDVRDGRLGSALRAVAGL